MFSYLRCVGVGRGRVGADGEAPEERLKVALPHLAAEVELGGRVQVHLVEDVGLAWGGGGEDEQRWFFF